MPLAPPAARTLVFWVLVSAGLPWQLSAADRIVLRNLDVISDKAVAAFDEDGVRFQDGSTLTWDRIERGRVDVQRQADFDRLLAELGIHLYRIRQRLTVGDYRGLLPHAEALYPRYVGRSSPSAYMVCQSLMWGRIADGQREAALEPYLRCYEMLRTRSQEDTVVLPGQRRLQFDLVTALTPELPPVWFDAEAAGQSLKSVAEAVAALSQPKPPGARIYFATMALAAGQDQVAQSALSGLSGLGALQAVVKAQKEVQQGQIGPALRSLEGQLDAMDGDTYPLALYWLGRAKLGSSDITTRRDGMLNLLKIGAVYGKRQPELAASGLFYTMRLLAEDGDGKGSMAVRRELLDRYGQTWHAALARKQ